MWTPQYALILNTLVKSNAGVVGYDIILPTTVENAEGIGDKLQGYDKAFRKALFLAARKGKVVLGKVQHKTEPVSPQKGYQIAVGRGKNIRLLNLGSRSESSDGVIRELPLWFGKTTDNSYVPSMAVELASRVAKAKLDVHDARHPLFGDYTIPLSAPASSLINFDTRADAIPVYSFADIYECARQGKLDYFQQHFKNKVVLIGVNLDVEDRKLTSMRYATSVEGRTTPPRCALAYDKARYSAQTARDTIPGVLVHAQGINNLLHRSFLTRSTGLAYSLWHIPLVLLVSLLTLFLSPSRAAIAAGIAACIWLLFVGISFNHLYVLPLFTPLLAALLAYLGLLIFRYTVLDKDKRVLKQVFSYYLEPAIIDRMVAQGQTPVLGGETRRLTVWFSDIANYTSISENLAPEAVVNFLNTYFSAMSEIVKQHGGFVDKYIGDAIVAVFGTPLDDPQHELHAVQSVMACREKLQSMMHEFHLPPNIHIFTRFGINTGEMLAGNIGSKNRLNYTVIGDEVNLASRLEAINKRYGSTIIVSETTKSACEADILFREVDAVRVKGKTQAVSIYEPIAEHAMASNTQIEMVRQFQSTLEKFRARRFTEALAEFRALASQGDTIAESFIGFTEYYIANPPANDWDGITTMQTK